jgi:hypothetical protein
MFKGVLVRLNNFDNGGQHVEFLPVFYGDKYGFTVYINSREIGEAIRGGDLGAYAIYVDDEGEWNQSWMD